MQTLKNDVLTVQVAEHGAELQSIMKGATEYLWQGDPAYWGRRSPVLFPIVGSVWEKRYRVDGVEYELGHHGFARDMYFVLVSATETEVRYRLESTEETLKKYPYQFVLEIAYRLHGNSLDVIWEVTNPDAEKVMHFQIGAHPAFIYPDYDLQNKERGYLVFDRTEDLQCIRIKEKGCVDAVTRYPLEIPADGKLPLASDTFDAIDTIMLPADSPYHLMFEDYDAEYFETQAGDDFYRFDLVMGGRDIEVDVNADGEVTPAQYGYF